MNFSLPTYYTQKICTKKETLKSLFKWRERRADLRTDDTKLVRIASRWSKLQLCCFCGTLGAWSKSKTGSNSRPHAWQLWKGHLERILGIRQIFKSQYIQCFPRNHTFWKFDVWGVDRTILGMFLSLFNKNINTLELRNKIYYTIFSVR